MASDRQAASNGIIGSAQAAGFNEVPSSISSSGIGIGDQSARNNVQNLSDTYYSSAFDIPIKINEYSDSDSSLSNVFDFAVDARTGLGLAGAALAWTTQGKDLITSANHLEAGIARALNVVGDIPEFMDNTLNNVRASGTRYLVTGNSLGFFGTGISVTAAGYYLSQQNYGDAALSGSDAAVGLAVIKSPRLAMSYFAIRALSEMSVPHFSKDQIEYPNSRDPRD